MGLKSKVAYNTFAQVVGKIVSAGVTFLITALVARNFGVYGYGEFTKIITYIPLFYLIADFGINAIFLREEREEGENRLRQGYGGQARETRELDFSYLLGLRLIWSLILIFLAISLIAFLPYNVKTNQGFTPLVKLGIIVGSLTILTQALYTSLNAVFQKFLRYDLSNLALSLGNIIGLLIVFLITNKIVVNFLKINGILLIMVAYNVCYLLIFLIAYFLAKKLIRDLSLKFDLTLFKKLFLQSLPLGITLIFNLVYFRIDTFILTAYRSTEEVGLYGLAYRFFETVLVIPTFFMNAVYPIMLERQKEGKEKFRQFIILNSKFMILASLICFIALVVSARFLITLVSGSSFNQAILPLKILSLSFPFFFLSSLFMWVLITAKKQTLLAIFYGLSMVLNISLNLVFIPKYGYMAAAITTGVTELFVLLLTGYTSLKYLKTQSLNLKTKT